jgi:hypothetical protein
MSYLSVYKSCINQFLDNWSHTPIELEGKKTDVDELDEFVRIQIFNDDSSNYSHGETPNKLLIGHAIVEIYTRRGEGVGRLIELTDLCVAIFSNTRIGAIKFDASQVLDRQQMITGETVVDPNWISKSVITRFRSPI